MKRQNLIRIMMAWMLLLTFTAALAIKDLHVHHDICHHTEKPATAHQAEVNASCFVCDFTMHKSGEVKAFEYIPVKTYTKIHKPQIFTSILVYRSVESVNAHAPSVCVG